MGRARQLGVAFALGNADFPPWRGQRADQRAGAGRADPGTDMIRYKWLIGADGQNSTVRSRAGMGAARYRRARFGFRRHYRVAPWTDVVEVHWGRRCQMFVTPTAPDEMCIALISNDAHMRIADALEQFPAVAAKLRGAAVRGARRRRGYRAWPGASCGARKRGAGGRRFLRDRRCCRAGFEPGVSGSACAGRSAGARRSFLLRARASRNHANSSAHDSAFIVDGSQRVDPAENIKTVCGAAGALLEDDGGAHRRQPRRLRWRRSSSALGGFPWPSAYAVLAA